jgi:Rieske Fe-S protein
MAEAAENLPRRGWLSAILQGAIAVTVVAIFYPVARFLRPRRTTVSGAQETVAPFRVNEISVAKNNPFNFAGRPCLVVLTSEGSKRLAQSQPLRADDVRAFDAVCTHVDCTVKYRSDQADIFCSCHNGVYDLNGHNVAGPPPRPLQTYSVVLRGEPGQEEIVVSRDT